MGSQHDDFFWTLICLFNSVVELLMMPFEARRHISEFMEEEVDYCCTATGWKLIKEPNQLLEISLCLFWGEF